MTKAAVLAFIGGAVTIVMGGVVAKFLHEAAGMALIAAGGVLIGKVQSQPRWARKREPSGE